jgi:hypothetical protein
MHVERAKLGGAEAPPDASPSDRVAIQQAVAWGFVAGFRGLALLAAALSLASALTALLMIDGARAAVGDDPGGLRSEGR